MDKYRRESPKTDQRDLVARLGHAMELALEYEQIVSAERGFDGTAERDEIERAIRDAIVFILFASD